MLRIAFFNRICNTGDQIALLVMNRRIPQRFHSQKPITEVEEKGSNKAESRRMAEFRKKLRETTPIDDLGEQPLKHAAVKEDPLPPWPDNTNPHTGEIGGPRGPEPTRYGDWERKGRVTDF